MVRYLSRSPNILFEGIKGFGFLLVLEGQKWNLQFVANTDLNCVPAACRTFPICATWINSFVIRGTRSTRLFPRPDTQLVPFIPGISGQSPADVAYVA